MLAFFIPFPFFLLSSFFVNESGGNYLEQLSCSTLTTEFPHTIKLLPFKVTVLKNLRNLVKKNLN